MYVTCHWIFPFTGWMTIQKTKPCHVTTCYKLYLETDLLSRNHIFFVVVHVKIDYLKKWFPLRYKICVSIHLQCNVTQYEHNSRLLYPEGFLINLSNCFLIETSSCNNYRCHHWRDPLVLGDTPQTPPVLIWDQGEAPLPRIAKLLQLGVQVTQEGMALLQGNIRTPPQPFHYPLWIISVII